MENTKLDPTKQGLLQRFQNYLSSGRLSPDMLSYWTALPTASFDEKATQFFSEPFSEKIVFDGSLRNLKRSIKTVQLRVAECCGVDVKFFTAKTRQKQDIADRRMLAMFLCYKARLGSTKFVGKAFNRHHTTVVHAMERIPTLLEQSPVLRSQYEKCLKVLAKDCRAAEMLLRT